jgi:hypothetical protein
MKIIRQIKALQENHQERHRSSGLGIVLADSIHYLQVDHWDGLVKNKSFFLTRPYLSVLESSGPSNLESRFGLIYRKHRPVAALHSQFVNVSGDQLSRQKSLRVFQERILVAGDLLSTGPHGVAFADGEDPGLLWPAVTEALYRLRRGEKLSGQTDIVLIKDLEGLEEGPAALKRFDYRPMHTQPNMVMDIPPTWKSYEDYLASLNSKYRKSIREVNQKVQEAGILLEEVHNLEPLKDKLHALYLQVQDQAEFRFFELPPSFLPALARSAPDLFSCIVLKRGEDILGFVTTLRDGNTTVGYFLGFDRQTNQTLPIYFRLLNAVVQKAIESGSSRLSFGRTALEPKARIGARPVPTVVWMRHRVPLVNLMVKRILGLIPHEEPPLRNPFK